MQATDDTGVLLDAEFEVEPEGDLLSLVMRSASGKSTGYPNGRNPQYNRTLELLLGRLRDLGAALVNGVVDSSRTRSLPESQRTILDQRVELADLADIEQFRRQLSRAQGRIGQTSDGNSTKQIRLRLQVPGYGAAEVRG
ncbi:MULTISPECIES: hypothetical protein [unclassified Saccharothrix]|uniref:hypothetical protein n=1 Tax=unclassified Saccharothrix TaxID=2593673 RepID=UPI00307E8136